jgi:hypothetical protein
MSVWLPLFWDNLGHFETRGLWAWGHFLDRLRLRRLKFIATPPPTPAVLLAGATGTHFVPSDMGHPGHRCHLPAGRAQIGSTVLEVTAAFVASFDGLYRTRTLNGS